MKSSYVRSLRPHAVSMAALVLVVALECGHAQLVTTIAGTDFPSGPGSSVAIGRCRSIACDRAGNCYVYSQGPDGVPRPQIFKVDTLGNVSLLAGNGREGDEGDGGPARLASMTVVNALAVDQQSNVYIAQGGRVRKVDSSGVISTVAGLPYSGLFSGGVLAITTTLYAAGIAVDATGNLYIADSEHGYIWRMDSAGVLSKVAGIGTPGYSGDGGPATLAKVQPSSSN